MHVIDVNPQLCSRWSLADRSDFEFGDILALSKDIKENGQIEPALLRPHPDQTNHYEIITGSRRWKACSEVNLPLKAIVQNLTDAQATVAQIRENQKLPLCDYSKGIHYAKLLATQQITHFKLAKLIGCSRAKLDNYLAFDKVPQDVWKAVDNLNRVSSRSATTIYQLSKRGKAYEDALIDLADDIKRGAGCKTIERKVLQAVQGISETIDYHKSISLSSGQPVAKWTKHGLEFVKDVPINQTDITNLLVQYFQGIMKTEHLLQE